MRYLNTGLLAAIVLLLAYQVWQSSLPACDDLPVTFEQAWGRQPMPACRN